jgi:hypothetical protein
MSFLKQGACRTFYQPASPCEQMQTNVSTAAAKLPLVPP